MRMKYYDQYESCPQVVVRPLMTDDRSGSVKGSLGPIKG